MYPNPGITNDWIHDDPWKNHFYKLHRNLRHRKDIMVAHSHMDADIRKRHNIP